MKKTLLPRLWLFLLCLLPTAFSAPAAEPLKDVSVIFHWKAQAQWAGYYMAKEKGIYAKHGLNVTLLSRRGRSDSLDQLMDGRVTFATHFLSAGVGLRGARQPVVLVGQVFNRSNLMVVARRSDGVEKITDLSGKSVCFWDGYYRFVFNSFFRDQGVVNLRERPMGLTVSQFTSKQVAACSAMEYNEYNLILNSPDVDRDDLIFFRLREMGMDFPEDAVYAAAETAASDPELCRAFVRATFEGWEYARDNPEETLAVVMRETRDDPDELATEDHQRWMLGVCIDSVFPPPDSKRRAGVLSRGDFTVMHAFLQENGQLRQSFSYDDFVKLDAVD